MAKIQLFYINGGMTFKNKKDYIHFLKNRAVNIEPKIRWAEGYLTTKLPKDIDIIRPRMPLQDNAKYNEWKIHFERHIPLLEDNIILLGQSLGAIFFAKYLSENTFPKKILATYLVCPPYDNTLIGEDLVGGFKLKTDLSLLEKQSPNLTLLFSKNDDCVPVSHADKYQKKLKNANIIIYESKNGHFKIPEFPEIVEMIKENIKKM